MKNYNNETVPSPVNMNSILQGLRALGGVMGLITMLIGLIYTTKIFMLILNVLKNPAEAQTLLSFWIGALSQGEMDLTIQGNAHNGTQLLALATLGALILILAWLSIKLITTGAQILSWILGDAKAVKKLLTHVFGPGPKPMPTNPPDTLAPGPNPQPAKNGSI